MKSIKAITILLTLILAFVNLSNQFILPDRLNPIQLTLPYTDKQTQIKLKFSLSQDLTVPYGFYFGITFPSTIQSLQTPSVSQCILSTGDITYSLSPVLSSIGKSNNQAETNIIYCRLIDSDLTSIPGGQSYELSISMNSPITVNWLSQIKLMITSSNDSNKLILDQAVMGNSGQYTSYGIVAPAPLQIESAFTTVKSGPCITGDCNIIYPNNSFDLTLSLKTNSFIPLQKQCLLVLEWTNQYDIEDIGVKSSAYLPNPSNSPLLLTLQSSSQQLLKLEAFDNQPNQFVLKNIGENLVAGRKFDLTVSGLRSRSVPTGIKGSITVKVYWKNSFSLISYNSFNDVIEVQKGRIVFNQQAASNPPSTWLGIAHPEFFDIYESGSWPMRFTFETQPIPIESYVRIEHTNTANRIWQFIASTCDFSDDVNSDLINQSLGQRPQCYPTNQDISSTSGIVFKIPPVSAKRMISVVVWGVAVKCSENTIIGDTPSYVDLGSVLYTQNYSKYDYKISIYSDLDQGNGITFNEDNKISESLDIPMFGLCRGTVISDGDSNTSDIFGDLYLDDTSEVSDILLYKEISKFMLTKTEGTEANGEVKVDLTDPTRFFYFSNVPGNRINNEETNRLQFGYIGSTITASSNDILLYQNIPMPIYNHSNNGIGFYKGSLILQLSRQWVTSGVESNADCRLNWITDDQVNLDSLGDNFISTSSSTLGTTISKSASTLYRQGGDYIVQPDMYVSPIRIKSDNSINNGESIFPKTMEVTVASNNKLEYLFFDTNCYKPVVPTKLKSIYNYLDFTYMYERDDSMSNTPTITRAVRFITLLPETGVIWDYSNSIIVDSESPVINSRYIWVISGVSRGSCLIEITKPFLNAADGNANSLMITLNNVKIFEPDYKSVSSVYPAAPVLETAIKIYPNKAVYPFSQFTQQGSLNSRNGDINTLIKNLHSEIVDDKSSDMLNMRYWWRFGSTLTITGINGTNKITSNTENADSLYIPIYCPDGLASSNSSNKYNMINPTMSSILLNYDSNNYNTISKISNITIKTGTNTVRFGTFLTSTSDSTPETSPFKTAVLKFNKFTLEVEEEPSKDYLYLWAKGSSTIQCDTFSLFLRSDIDLSQTISNITFKSSSMNVSNLSNAANYDFYYYGFRFNKSIINYQTTITFTQTEDFINSVSSDFFTGIVRPSPLNLTTSNFPNNSLAFTCVGSTATDGKGFGMNNYSSGSNTFEASFFNEKLNVGWDVVFALDVPTQKTYRSSRVLGLNYSIKLPTNLAADSILEFASDSIVTKTICAIRNQDNSNASYPCSNINTNTISCSLSQYGNASENTRLDICCYNALSKNSSPSIINAKVVTSNVRVSEIASPLNSPLETENGSSELTSTIIPTISQIIYTQVNQQNGLGKVYMLIDLGIQAFRNMIVRINGPFGLLYLESNSKPNAIYTFSHSSDLTTLSANTINLGNNPDSGDFLIHSAVMPSSVELGTNINIDLYNKNIIYKCGLSLSDRLVLILWPIRVQSFTASRYWVSLQLGDENETITATSPNVETQRNEFVSIELDENSYEVNTEFSSSKNLCDLKSIFPRIAGNLADYVFDFDLTMLGDINSDSPSVSRIVNEVTIVFDHKLFSGSFENFSNGSGDLICTHESLPVICSMENGFLNARFDEGLNTKEVVSIKILGIRNPILTETNPSFYCSVNFYNSIDSSRQNLLIGKGNNNISTFNIQSTGQGNLIILSADVSPPQSLIPREITESFDLRFMVDTTQGMNSLPQNFEAQSSDTNQDPKINSPLILVDFPFQFNLHYSDTSNMEIRIEKTILETNEVILSGNPTKRMTRVGTAPVISSFDIIGNRISLYLQKPSFDIDTQTVYYTLKFLNLPNPWLAYSPESISQFRITLMNDSSAPTKIFRSYDNLNTQFHANINSSQNINLNWYRGYSYTFSNNNKSQINVNDDNLITIRPGRYETARMGITSAVNVGSQAQVKITLNENSIFKLYDNNIIINTGTSRSQSFEIGCKCSTLPGLRYINFSSDNNIGFYRLAPVLTETLDISPLNFATISLGLTTTSKSTVVFGSSGGGALDIFIRGDARNFDIVNLSISNTIGHGNSSSSNLPTSVSIPASRSYTRIQFRNTNSQDASPQKYTIKSNNNCFRFANQRQTQDITINLDLDIADLTSFSLSNKVTYHLPTSTTDLDSNSIKFTYKNTIPNVYLFCSLVCEGTDFPTDSQIMNLDQPMNTPNVQHYWRLFEQEEDYDLIFSGLIRGRNYKLRCIVSSTEANNRHFVNSTFTEFNIPGSLTNPNKPRTISNDPGFCLRYYFTSPQVNDTLKAIIRSVQQEVSSGGFENQGCVVVRDSRNYGVVGYVPEVAENCTIGLANNLYTEYAKQIEIIESGSTASSSSTSSSSSSSTSGTSGSNTTNTNISVNASINTTTNSSSASNLRYLQDNSTGLEVASTVVVTPYSLTLCGVQNPTCPTQVNIIDKMRRIWDETSDESLLSNFLNGRQITGRLTVLQLEDLEIQNSKINIANMTYSTNWLNFTASYDDNLTDVTCYWKLNDIGQSQGFSTEQISDCTVNANSTWINCGSILLTRTNVRFLNFMRTVPDGSYNVWMFCRSNLPGSRKTSSPATVGSQIITINTNNGNNGNGNQNNTNGNTTRPICNDSIIVDCDLVDSETRKLSLISLIIIFIAMVLVV